MDKKQLIKEEIESQREQIKKFGWRKMFSKLFRSAVKDETERTYQIWKPYFKMAGKKLKREDCRKIRNNMVRLADKLYEINDENIAEIDAEFDRRIK